MPNVTDGLDLPVMESFYTIQGEGFYTGRPAFFIRLAGCDVGCVWCDVKASWDAAIYPLRKVDDLVKEVMGTPARFVVITGGEPAIYDLEPLTRSLHAAGCEIAIETSGAYVLRGEIDWVCVSPKKFKAPLPEMLQMADELKVVVFHSSDFNWAEENAISCKPDCLFFLQPEYDRFDVRIPEIIDYVKTHPKWRLSLQTHKIINVP